MNDVIFRALFMVESFSVIDVNASVGGTRRWRALAFRSALQQLRVNGEFQRRPILYRTLADRTADTVRYKISAPGATVAV